MSKYSDVVEAIPGLIAYWRLGEAPGETVAIDETGVYNATYVNAPTLGVDGLLDGDSNTAVEFNGVDQYVDILNQVAFNISTYSVVMVIQISAYPASTVTLSKIADSYGATTQDKRLELNADGTVGFYVFDGAVKTVISTQNIPLNQPILLCATVDGSGLTLRVDEFAPDTIAANGSHTGFTTATQYIGGHNNTTGHFSGIIDDVSVFNAAITQADYASLYDAFISGVFAFDISIDHTKISEDLYDFPLLVNLGATSGIDAFDSNGVFDELNIPNHQYWKLHITANNSNTYIALSEIQFVDANGNDLTNPVSSGSLATAGSEYAAGYEAEYSFDNDEATFWHNDGLVIDYITYDTNDTDGISPVGIKILPRAANPDYSPKDFTVQYSDNGTDWTAVLSITGHTDWTSGVYEEWDFDIFDSGNLKLLTAVYKNPADNTYPSSVDDDFVGADGDSPDRDLWINGVDRYDLSVVTDILVINSNTITPALANVDASAVSEWTIEGDFDVQIDTTMGTYAGTDAVHFRMLFEKSSQFDRIEIYRDVSSTIVYSYASLDGSTVLNINNDILVANSKFRITRVGNLLKTYYDIGGGWVEHGSAIIPFAISSKVGVSIRNNVLNTHSIDNFLVNSGIIVWAQPADTSVISQQCKVEIDRWDQTNQQSQLPIIVPYISKDVDTVINLSYDPTNVDNSDNIGETGTLPARLVWSEYDAVYHLSKDGADSAINSLDGTLVNIDDANIVDFGIGKGMTFNGIDERVDLTVDDLGRVYTISMIIELTDVTGVKTLVDGGNGGWYIDGGKISYNTTSDGTTALVATTSYEIVLQDNNGVGSTYINGVIADSITPDAVNMLIDTIAAETGTPANHFSGKLKEIRFSKDLKSAAWIAATYESMRDNLVRYEHADSFVLDKIISGTITETLAVVQWLIRSYDYATGALVASMVSPNGVFELSIPVGYWTPQSVTISPDQGIVWSPETAKDIGDLVFPNDPVATPYYFQCTISGTVGDGVTGTTEPDFNSNTLPGNTVVDGNVTWEVVERMVQPITHSPLIPI